MKIYHGQTSPKAIEKCREAAPSYTHGACWVPGYATPHDWPYIFDNGVYSAWVRDEDWDERAWRQAVRDLDQMPRDPDFVVLPDIVGGGMESRKQSSRCRGFVPDEYATAFAAQDGMPIGKVGRWAYNLGCDAVFIGGTHTWKRQHAAAIVTEAHERDLDAHIARPGLPDGLIWAERIGADSVDTTSIARSKAYYHLRALEEQTRLPGLQS